MQLEIQATVAIVLVELEAISNRNHDMQVFHRQEQDKKNDDSDENEGSRSTFSDIIGNSQYLCYYFD